MPSSVDNYSLFVSHFDNWIKQVADVNTAFRPEGVVKKVREALQRNADSNAYHYARLAKLYRESGDEILARHCDMVAHVYNSLTQSV
jgi:hypothetical protein